VRNLILGGEKEWLGFSKSPIKKKKEKGEKTMAIGDETWESTPHAVSTGGGGEVDHEGGKGNSIRWTRGSVGGKKILRCWEASRGGGVYAQYQWG